MLHKCIILQLALVIICESLLIVGYENFIPNYCTPQLDVKVYRCNHRRLTDIPVQLHRLTTELDLSYNLIEILHEDSFTRLQKLQKLILSHNQIYKITERAFVSLGSSLKVLDLSNNQLVSNRITPFPTTAFAPLIRLTHINLASNPIGLLPKGFLQHMGSTLQQLDLSSIPVKLNIQPGAFRTLAKLTDLNLARNKLIEFNQNVFHGLRYSQIRNFSLQDVQWVCNCHLLWFRRWLNLIQSSAFSADTHPGGECISPPAFKGLPLLSVNLTDLQCTPKLLTTIPSSQNVNEDNQIRVLAYHGHNLSLSCTFLSDPKMQVEWFRNGVLIQPHWKRLTQHVGVGTRFTTTLQFDQLDKIMDEGIYRCQTANQKGTAGASFVVQIRTSRHLDDFTNKLVSEDMQVHSTKQQELRTYFLLVGIIIAVNVAFIVIGTVTYFYVRFHNCTFFKRDKEIQQNYSLHIPKVSSTELTKVDESRTDANQTLPDKSIADQFTNKLNNCSNFKQIGTSRNEIPTKSPFFIIHTNEGENEVHTESPTTVSENPSLYEVGKPYYRLMLKNGKDRPGELIYYSNRSNPQDDSCHRWDETQNSLSNSSSIDDYDPCCPIHGQHTCSSHLNQSESDLKSSCPVHGASVSMDCLSGPLLHNTTKPDLERILDLYTPQNLSKQQRKDNKHHVVRNNTLPRY